MGIEKEEKGGRVLCNTSQRGGKGECWCHCTFAIKLLRGPSVGKVLEAYAPLLLLHKHYYRISDFPPKNNKNITGEPKRSKGNYQF